jgi:hypothetical protein
MRRWQMLKPLGTIYISNCRVEKDEASHKNRNENVFVIVPPRAVGGRVFFLSAESAEEMQNWMQVLGKSAAASLDKSFGNPGELVIDSFGNKVCCCKRWRRPKVIAENRWCVPLQ